MILKLNKKDFSPDYLISLLKKIQIEKIARKSKANKNILKLAAPIDHDWWAKNGKTFLKDVEYVE